MKACYSVFQKMAEHLEQKDSNQLSDTQRVVSEQSGRLPSEQKTKKEGGPEEESKVSG